MGYKINGHPELNPYISMFAHSIEHKKKETGRKKKFGYEPMVKVRKVRDGLNMFNPG